MHVARDTRAGRDDEAAIGRREAVVALAVGIALALLMNLPLVAHLGTQLPERPAWDTALQAWLLAWGGHALVEQPLSFFDANVFWPMRDSLAATESLAGYAPFALLGSGPEAAILRHNLIHLAAYALAFFAMYLLARELRLRPLAAALAGAVYSFAPYRMSQYTHLHVVSSGGIALALFLLVRGYRRRRPGTIVAGYAVAAWQVAVTLTLGLMLLYLLAALAVVAAGYAIVRRARVPGRVVVASVIGAVLLGSVVGVVAAPYIRVRDAHPAARRSVEEVRFHSPPPRALLAAARENALWGRATDGVRSQLSWPTEQALFPGLSIVVLAAVGVVAGALPRALRRWLLGGALVVTVLSFGFNGPFGGRFTYGLLYEHAPGWQGVRTPGRLMILVLLALALLAAAAADHLVARVSRRDAGRAAMLGFALIGVVLLEGATRVSHSAPAPVPASWVASVSPQMHLPAGIEYAATYMYWSISGFPELANGYGAFVPEAQRELTEALRTFPDRRSVAAARRYGLRLVVLHPEMAEGTPWEGAEDRSVAGLGIRREARGDAVLYHLDARAG